MIHILSIETSTTVCSVAVHGDGKLTGQLSLYTEKSHSAQLGKMVSELMRSCELENKDLDAVAVSGGPGSYTGLRIGCSLAKGMCYALEIPLIAVSTLEALGRQVQRYIPAEALLCPMLDARRMEVYTMMMDREGRVLTPVHPLILDATSFEEHLNNREIWFFGNGSGKAAEVIRHPNATFIPGITTEARAVGELAFGKFGREEFEDVAYYEPFYLKEFQATKPKKKL